METSIDVTANEVVGMVMLWRIMKMFGYVKKYVKMGATKWQISCRTLVKPSKALVNELELEVFTFYERHAFEI